MLDSSDHFYIQIKVLESAGAAASINSSGLVCIKGQENLKPNKCSALGILQSVSGFPVWEQSQAYYGFVWLNPIQMNI
jgi:hypothetical protein